MRWESFATGGDLREDPAPLGRVTARLTFTLRVATVWTDGFHPSPPLA
jgi:hypothetical protein